MSFWKSFKLNGRTPCVSQGITQKWSIGLLCGCNYPGATHQPELESPSGGPRLAGVGWRKATLPVGKKTRLTHQKPSRNLWNSCQIFRSSALELTGVCGPIQCNPWRRDVWEKTPKTLAFQGKALHSAHAMSLVSSQTTQEGFLNPWTPPALPCLVESPWFLVIPFLLLLLPFISREAQLYNLSHLSIIALDTWRRSDCHSSWSIMNLLDMQRSLCHKRFSHYIWAFTCLSRASQLSPCPHSARCRKLSFSAIFIRKGTNWL